MTLVYRDAEERMNISALELAFDKPSNSEASSWFIPNSSGTFVLLRRPNLNV